MTSNVGKLLQSNGKYEPDHWFHLVVADLGNGEVETRDINNHNTNSITLDGYKEVDISEVNKGIGFSLEEYLDWCITDITYLPKNAIINVMKNIDKA